MAALLDVLRSGRVLLMDGAMGTQLQCLGLRSAENAAAWNLLFPERVEHVHQSYAAAGAEVLLTNTFLINADSYGAALEPIGGQDPALGWTEALRRVGPRGRYCLAAVGPVAEALTRREFDDLRALHLPEKNAAPDVRVPDAILLETCSTPRALLAVERARQTGLAVLLSLAFRRDEQGRLATASGHSPEWFAQQAISHGVDALGVNCGRDIGMDEIIEIIRRFRQASDLPLFARPNAGTPVLGPDGLAYPATPAAMAARLEELLQAGVCMVGGCCGTTPAHVAAWRKGIDDWNARHTEVTTPQAVGETP